jgi:hypothetical protein
VPSGWGSYYVIFLAAGLALSVPAALALASYFLAGRRPPAAPGASAPAHSSERAELGQRMNVRIFLATNAALLLVALGLAILPCAITIHAREGAAPGRGLLAVVSLAAFGGIGLLYAARKGDLSWLETFQRKEGRE